MSKMEISNVSLCSVACFFMVRTCLAADIGHLAEHCGTYGSSDNGGVCRYDCSAGGQLLSSSHNTAS